MYSGLSRDGEASMGEPAIEIKSDWHQHREWEHIWDASLIVEYITCTPADFSVWAHLR